MVRVWTIRKSEVRDQFLGPVGELALVTLGNRMGHCMGLRMGYSMSTVPNFFWLYLRMSNRSAGLAFVFYLFVGLIVLGFFCTCRVQEQENQKRKLCDELEQLKTPQDSREASCQTPVPEEEVRQEDESGAEMVLPETEQQSQHLFSL